LTAFPCDILVMSLSINFSRMFLVAQLDTFMVNQRAVYCRFVSLKQLTTLIRGAARIE